MQASPWQIELLGRLRARRDGQVVQHFRTQKTGALLAYLAYYPHQTHPREVLVDLLWPDAEPSAGRNNLSRELSALRSQLEPTPDRAATVIRADRFAVNLDSQAISTDVGRFTLAVADARRDQPASERAACLSAAIDAYRGDLLPGFYEDWVVVEREHLAGQYLWALGELLTFSRSTGDNARALDLGRRALRIDPLREATTRELMELHSAAGEPAAAMRVFQELAAVLAVELGVEPSPETRRVAEELGLAGNRSDGLPVRERWPVPAPDTPVPRSLPAGTVTFLAADLGEEPRAGPAIREARGSDDWAACRSLLEQAAARNDGHALGRHDGPFLAVFGRAGDAIAAAIDAKRSVRQRAGVTDGEHPPPAVGDRQGLRVAVASGDVDTVPYPAAATEPVMAMLSASHPGHVLCAQSAVNLVRRDLEPGWQLTDLGRYRLHVGAEPSRLFHLREEGLDLPEPPPPRAERFDVGRLPLPLTTFFGREWEMAGLPAELLAGSARLVTLTGPPGSGKTRLALEVAATLEDPFRGAVWFVPLADVRDAGAMLEAVADAMQLPRPAGQTVLGAIAEAVADRESLLVLDDFEHLVDGGAAEVEALLRRTRSLRCLVTSRRRLSVPGELERPVHPLLVPHGRISRQQAEASPSVQLFLDRAKLVQPGFGLTDANANQVAALCERLEGIPLALELAAARAHVLTPAQMLDRLDKRFELLSPRRGATKPRHETLRAAIDCSFELLTPALQRFLAQLTVFRGGWSLEAAEVVTENPLAIDDLAQLVDTSLIDSGDDGRPTLRFHMLETLREYAAELLSGDEGMAAQERHAAYFARVAEQAASHLKGVDQASALATLETEYANLRVALERSMATGGEPDLALRIGAALARYWHVRGHLTEGRALLETLLGQSADAANPLVAAILDGLGTLATQQGDHEAAGRFYEKSLAAKHARGDERGVAETLRGMGNMADEQGRYADAKQHYEAALDIYTAIGDRWGVAAMQNNLGLLSQNLGDAEAARDWLSKSLVEFRRLGEGWAVGVTLSNLGGLALDAGDHDAATSFYAESLAMATELGDRLGVAGSLTGLANVAVQTGDLAAARELFARSVVDLAAVEDLKDIAEWLEFVAALAHAEDDPRRATRLLGAADALRARIGTPVAPKEEAERERRLADLRAALGEAAFTAACAEGRRMAWREAVAGALGGGVE